MEQQQQLQTETLTEHPLNNAYGSLNDICYELSSLQDLACRGSWKSILDKVSRARTQALLSKPHEHLVYLTFNTLGLMKLRRFSDAVKEIDTLEDGIDNVIYSYQNYPQHYPGRVGSMAPFALRWLYAELPSRVGDRQESVDRFYMLLDYVREKMSKSGLGSGDVWRKREGLVINSIISHHLSHKEFGVCLELIKDLMKRDESAVGRAVLMSQLGYIQMQLGDLEGAKASFNVVEGIVNEEKMQVEMKNLVNRNKALMFMVGKDYVSAVREYQECIDRDATDVVAINNKGLCLMYLRDLADGIKVLEKALESVPTAALNETLVVNLCSMYELAYVNHTDTKKTLSNWIARVAPDDFDSSCTRV
uniref:Trafficking protein particle complex subunit 12-like n=1 Tax=Tanacetum cinerariifolium TaxID=118510 RepID=A0A6L2JEB6_TANCI|nr:trafficking protein particle complex subunit 12-like [Tanacetum cinerariifolium]